MKTHSAFAWLAPGLAAVALSSGSSAFGHHSAAMFETNRVEELRGTVREFQWTNPHTWIQVLVEDAEGEVTEWSIEWGGLNSLARRGYRPNTFQAGDEVRIRFRPHIQGAPAGVFVAARFADGNVVGTWE
jgi:hypothetical protein